MHCHPVPWYKLPACLVTSVVSDSCDAWTVAHQAPLSMGYPRQEYWSGLPFPSPGDLLYPGVFCLSCLAGGFFSTAPPGKPIKYLYMPISLQYFPLALSCLLVTGLVYDTSSWYFRLLNRLFRFKAGFLFFTFSHMVYSSSFPISENGIPLLIWTAAIVS